MLLFYIKKEKTSIIKNIFIFILAGDYFLYSVTWNYFYELNLYDFYLFAFLFQKGSLVQTLQTTIKLVDFK